MIEGVVVKQLKPIADERGYLMEIFRSDDPFFEKFGQSYLTVVYPGVVKGWHYHKLQVDHFCAVKGMAKVVLYDDREGSKTRGEVNEYFMGEKNPILLRIPAGVLHGMKGIGTESSPPNMIGTAPASRMLRVVASISARLPGPSFGLVLRLPRSHTVWPWRSKGPPRSQSQWLSQSASAWSCVRNSFSRVGDWKQWPTKW